MRPLVIITKGLFFWPKSTPTLMQGIYQQSRTQGKNGHRKSKFDYFIETKNSLFEKNRIGQTGQFQKEALQKLLQIGFCRSFLGTSQI